MILRPELPRSLAACYAEVADTLEAIAIGQGGRMGECHRQAGLLKAQLRYGRIDDIFEEGLHAFLTGMITRTAEPGRRDRRLLHQALSQGAGPGKGAAGEWRLADLPRRSPGPRRRHLPRREAQHAPARQRRPAASRAGCPSSPRPAAAGRRRRRAAR